MEEVIMRWNGKVILVVTTALLGCAALVWAAIIPYSQDFESLVQSDPDALANDGWQIFGNRFNLDGSYVDGYGPFPAPNGGPGFCAIAAGEGGPSQGAQQLVVYSDYNNPNQVGFIIEANVFQEQTIDAGDVGAIIQFSFDAKLGDLTGSSEAYAFIKTIDPNPPFPTTNFVTADMTAIPTTWGTYSLELEIDAGLVGQILQFGFAARATDYEASGVFYDNINQPVPVDLMSISVD
jgi:hypothetical protein